MREIFDQTFVFVWLPLGSNTVLAIAAFFINPADFKNNIFVCYLTVSTALSSSLASFLGFKIHDVGPRRMLLALTTQSATLIFIFAGIYRGFGLIFSGDQLLFVSDAKSALYFSVVTWTTLGYGDFTPPPDLRLIAAAQALLGYAFFGISVGLGTSILCERSPSARQQ